MQQLDVECCQPGKIPGIGEVLRAAHFRRRVCAVDSGMINIIRDFPEPVDDLDAGQVFGVLG